MTDTAKYYGYDEPACSHNLSGIIRCLESALKRAKENKDAGGVFAYEHALWLIASQKEYGKELITR